MTTEMTMTRAQSIQYIFTLDPRTLLTGKEIAPAINKTPSTVETNTSRRPQALPKQTVIDGSIFFKVSDLLVFMGSGGTPNRVTSVVPVQAPSKRRVGRPTNAERLAQAGRTQSQLAA